MISLILMEKIVSLFLVMFMGVVLVKCGVIKSEESKSISIVSLYLIMPCVILSAFQVDCTPEVRDGLMLAAAAAVAVHIGLIFLAAILKRPLHLDEVEQTSIIYSNAGSLIIPLVTAILGKEWVIYSSAFVSVQLVLLWSHAKAVICGEKKLDLVKIVTNVNMLAIFAGIVLFVTGIRFPGPVQDAVDSVGGMVGPAAMLVTGMLIGNMDFKKVLSYRRLLLIVPMRLIVMPALVLVFLKYSGIAGFVENGSMILLVTLLATITPSASTITQMAQVYGKDADYASAINVTTTLLCIVTMPLMVALYQM